MLTERREGEYVQNLLLFFSLFLTIPLSVKCNFKVSLKSLVHIFNPAVFHQALYRCVGPAVSLAGLLLLQGSDKSAVIKRDAQKTPGGTQPTGSGVS